MQTPTPNGKPRFAAEMLATADAIRQIRTRLSQLIADGDSRVVGASIARSVLVEGLEVQQALEALAARFDAAE